MRATFTTPVRVLLVDDHQVVRVGLRALLRQDEGFEVVGEAHSVATAVQQATVHQPDVVLLDVRLPDGSGLEACRQIRERCRNTRVIFLTSFADDEAILATISAGADGYLLKEIDWDALVRSIRTVMSGQSILDVGVKERVSRQLSSPKPRHDTAGLSYQEQRVLMLLSKGQTNKEIAAALGLSDKTVKNYVSHIFSKLHVSRRSQAAAFYLEQHRSQ